MQQNAIHPKIMLAAVVIIGLIGFQCGNFFNTALQANGGQNASIKGKGQGQVPQASYNQQQYQTINHTQLINDSYFTQSPSPWNISKVGNDPTDMAGAITGDGANTTVIGDNQTFSLVDPNFSQGWTMTNNPQYPAYPEWPLSYLNNQETGNNSVNASRGIDQYGVWARESWDEDALQQTSIQWYVNVSTPVNMSDYAITFANVTALVNATVPTSSGNNGGTYLTNPGLECTASQSSNGHSGTQFNVGDYANFYVRVADAINSSNTFTIASNRTRPDLGLVANQYTNYTTQVPNSLLIAYLNAVLSTNHKNFTIIVGIDFQCEDNQPIDWDVWNMTRIMGFNLTFTMQKQINQGTAVNWVENMVRFNSNDSRGSGDSAVLSILNATLNFNYKLSQAWPTSSPNSEIQVYINNYLNIQTLKLSNATTSFQQVNDGAGFDVHSLIFPDQNLNISIRVAMLDTFFASQNISLILDDVNLTVYFTATVQTQVFDTELQLIGPPSAVITWNEPFNVTAIYSNTTVEGSGGIQGATISVNWIDTYAVQEIGNGAYNITCSTYATNANQQYSLQISAQAPSYQAISNTTPIVVSPRLTNMNLSINGTSESLSPDVTVPWQSIVNFTTSYYDATLPSIVLTNATEELIGTNLQDSYFSLSQVGNTYQILLNTSNLDFGPHVLLLYAYNTTNFATASATIHLNVATRATTIQVALNQSVTTSYELNWGQSLNVTAWYQDNATKGYISEASVNLTGAGLSILLTANGNQYETIVDSSALGVGIFTLTLAAQATNYSASESIFYLKVDARPTDLQVALNQTVTTSYELNWGQTLNVTAWYQDNATKGYISEASVNLTGAGLSVLLSANGNQYETVVDASTLGVGIFSLTLSAQATNYSISESILYLKVDARPTNIQVVLNQNATASYELAWGQSLNVTAWYQDNATKGYISEASVNLTGAGLSIFLSAVGNQYATVLDSSTLSVGIYSLTLSAQETNYTTSQLILYLKVDERPTFLSIFNGSNNENITQLKAIDIPITGNISLNIGYSDALLGTGLDHYNITVQGLNATYYSMTISGSTTNLFIDTRGMQLGIYIVSILAQKSNYEQVSLSYQLDVNQIQTNITTIDFNQTYTVTPNGNLTITIRVTDIDFNRPIVGCTLTYTSKIGSGNFTDNGDGTYTAVIPNIPEGENDIYISTFKDPSYHFDSKMITVVAVAASVGGLPLWLIYVLVGAIVSLGVLFVQYQRVWKYPVIIRKLRKVISSMKKGKPSPLSFRSPDSTFAEPYLSSSNQYLALSAQNQLINRFLNKKKQGMPVAPAQVRPQEETTVLEEEMPPVEAATTPLPEAPAEQFGQATPAELTPTPSLKAAKVPKGKNLPKGKGLPVAPSAHKFPSKPTVKPLPAAKSSPQGKTKHGKVEDGDATNVEQDKGDTGEE